MNRMLEAPWVEQLVSGIMSIINPVLIIASVAGIIYAVVVGIRFVKADDKSARDEAKQKLVIVITGIVVTIVLIALFFWLQNALRNNMINFRNWW